MRPRATWHVALPTYVRILPFLGELNTSVCSHCIFTFHITEL
uniref:Uncharacterized protein n=1 Tax=Anguilla anguilla TaxID=7936 RepID=A0A0E9TG21_ANGAN